MARCFFFFLLFVIAGSGYATASAAAAGIRSSSLKLEIRRGRHVLVRRPGFLYTRNQGRCTPQFWSSGREPWPSMVSERSSVWKVFGSIVLERYEPGMTLLEATQRNDDIGGGSAYAKLIKQSSAALLNAYARPGFPFGAWEVKSLLIEALVSEAAAASQADRFEQANGSCT